VLEQGLDWLSTIPSVQVAINILLDNSKNGSSYTLHIRFSPKFKKGVIVPTFSLRPDRICNALWDTIKTKLVCS